MTNKKENEKIIEFLRTQLHSSLQRNDLESAAKAMKLLEQMLANKGRDTLLMKYKTYLFEGYMNIGEYTIATNGLEKIRKTVGNSTRLWLEASSLLAICYLRSKNIDKAEPIIKEVLLNDKVIKTPHKRFEFKKSIIERFNEEGILFGVKGDDGEQYDLKKVEKEIQKIIGLPIDDIYANLGKATPKNAIDILVRVDSFSKLQLPSGEKKMLSPPIKSDENEIIGKKLFSSFKRTIYRYVCDKDSQVYMYWNKGMDGLNVASLIELFRNAGINQLVVIVPAATLLLRMGIDWYCSTHKPDKIMDMRNS